MYHSMLVTIFFLNIFVFSRLQYRQRSQSHSRAQSRQSTPINEENGDGIFVASARVTTDDYPTMTPPRVDSDIYVSPGDIPYKPVRVNSDVYTDANGFTRATASDTYIDKNGFTRAMPDCYIPGATTVDPSGLGSSAFRRTGRSYMGMYSIQCSWKDSLEN